MAFVVFAGQSNTGGAYQDGSTVPHAWKPDPKTLIWDAEHKAWVQMQPGVNTGFGHMPEAWGPEVQFAIAFRQAHPDETLYIIKSTWGGSRLDYDPGQWHYDWSPRSDDELFDRTTQMIHEAGAAIGGVRPGAVFWGQGEEDANFRNTSEAYDENLPAFFAAVRQEWLADANGKIGFFRISGTPAFGAEVRHAQLVTDEADPNAESFDSRPFPLMADNVHFTAAGQQMSGDAFFRLYEAWRTGAPPPQDNSGKVLNSGGPGDALMGGAGNDTLNASRGADILTGGAGDDRFAWAEEPWSPGRVTDFDVGHDVLDISRLLAKAGYAGNDPAADGYVYLFDDGAGGTKVLFDHDGPGGDWPNYIIQLEHLPAGGLTWAQLTTASAPPPQPPPAPPPPPPAPPPQQGEVLTSTGPGDTLQGGAGADTLNASRGSDVLTGGGGADRFVFAAEPWSPAEITDFTPGADKIDLRALFDAAGFTGADPFAAGYLKLLDDGAGGTKVLFDRDGPGPSPQWANYVIHLQGVAPAALTGSDWIVQ
ncbi:sialate O-acetylesterase [Phenylobacterium sp.]|uniref:sialate O-acetylesterase n=1 Tax=Phenylobacterium sp. TaxID=1871053 RepID=UPI002F928972